MAYFVHVDCVPPPGTAPLDPLQRAGAAHIFGRLLELLDAVEAADGSVMEVASSKVGVHPDGAVLLLLLDAPTLELAESATRTAIEEVLDAAEEFTGWSVASCEVRLHDELTRQSLAAADGPDAPPSDLQERARRLRGHTVVDDADDVDEDAEAAAQATALRALAGRLTHGLDAFGYIRPDDADAREAAELAAGAVVYAISVLTDELFADLVELAQDDRSVADSDAELLALGLLPPAFAAQYQPAFVRRFILATAAMAQRLTSPSPSGPGSTAEELALRLLLSEAVAVLEMYDLYDDATEAPLAAFKDTVFDDYDHERLYDAGLDNAAEDVMAWFQPFQVDAPVHPYVLDHGD
ncbi:hypothetical protein GCM10023205_76060 [Yinghuangia aomiensis]|uniref:Uncharacterized protein n=1 Tax=Yinghuangia aomiensis TaxID=676205 RepID=A0ABP9I9R8_9ACTN